MARVLHLYSLLGSNTERAWLDYTLALRDRGWDIAFAYETKVDDAPPIPVEHTRLERIRVEPTDDIDGQMQRVAGVNDDAAHRELVQRDFALVHGHLGTRVLHAAAWLERGIPVVISLYGYDASRLLRDASWEARYRWAAERGATFVTLCEPMRQRIVDAGVPRERTRLIPVGIDSDAWAFEPPPAPLSPRFLFVGRLTEKKAPDDLLRALAGMRSERGVDAKLEVVGDGPLRESLRELAEQLGIAQHVRWLGELPRSEVADAMRRATAMVLPSVVAEDGDREGTPVVLMEAAALGVPCVTTRHMGNPDVLPDEGQRFVVEERDPAGLADAMARIAWLSPEQRAALQRAGREHIEHRF
ncbi:MAG: glycosyltransferase, partial [Phycisphaeraceae bacterium]